MAVDNRKDPLLNQNFLVEIEGLVVGGFSEVTGLQIEIEVEPYREGGLNEFLHLRAGPTRYPSNLVLRHGLTDADTLWRWLRNVSRGIVERHNGSIVLLNNAGEEKWRWNFIEAYPVRWTGPQLRAGIAAVALESLELAHRGLSSGK